MGLGEPSHLASVRQPNPLSLVTIAAETKKCLQDTVAHLQESMPKPLLDLMDRPPLPIGILHKLHHLAHFIEHFVLVDSRHRLVHAVHCGLLRVCWTFPPYRGGKEPTCTASGHHTASPHIR